MRENIFVQMTPTFMAKIQYIFKLYLWQYFENSTNKRPITPNSQLLSIFLGTEPGYEGRARLVRRYLTVVSCYCKFTSVFLFLYTNKIIFKTLKSSMYN